MWTTALCGITLLLLTTETLTTQACSSRDTSPPSTVTPPSSTPPASDVFTTADGVRFVVQTAVASLEVPWSMALSPDGRVFLTERAGRVRILDVATMTAALALTLDDVFAEGEAGLLGLALDPEFTQSRFVYLYYSAGGRNGPVNRLVRYREVANRLSDRVVLLDDVPAAQIHDGGRLRFGPDGLLYVTTGDAANPALAQDLAAYAGKILRLNRDGSTPRDNPFPSPVFSYGHRNPQGVDWHPTTGELWASEHGQTGNDEINLIRAGRNYGWPRIEGAAAQPGMESPATHFNPAIAPSGASFYRGALFPQFVDNLFVTTLRGTQLLRLRIDAATGRITSQERLLEGRFGRLRDVQAGPDGALYVLTNNRDGRGTPIATDDRMLRIVPAP